MSNLPPLFLLSPHIIGGWQPSLFENFCIFLFFCDLLWATHNNMKSHIMINYMYMTHHKKKIANFMNENCKIDFFLPLLGSPSTCCWALSRRAFSDIFFMIIMIIMFLMIIIMIIMILRIIIVRSHPFTCDHSPSTQIPEHSGLWQGWDSDGRTWVAFWFWRW